MRIRSAVLVGAALVTGAGTARAEKALRDYGPGVVLGRLPTGATVTFTPVEPAGWGVAVAGGVAPRIAQDQPVRLEVFNSEEDVRELATPYSTVVKVATGIEARADVASRAASCSTCSIDGRSKTRWCRCDGT